MVYGIYNELVTGAFVKPTNISWGPHIEKDELSETFAPVTLCSVAGLSSSGAVTVITTGQITMGSCKTGLIDPHLDPPSTHENMGTQNHGYIALSSSLQWPISSEKLMIEAFM